MTRGGPESSARPDGRVAGRDAPAGAAESPRRGPGCRGRTAPRGDDRLAATDEERDSRPQHFMSVGAPRGSASSLRALEWLNAVVADVRAGVGPYLAIYLGASRHWDPEQIGLAMSAMDVASVLGQTPAGALTDRARGKRLLGVPPGRAAP